MSSYTVITRSDELYHYGILGMKWGVRRYQDSSGRLTDAGKERYGYSKKELKKKIKESTKNYKQGKNIIQKYNIRGMTGENYRDVYNKMEKRVNNDAQLQSLDRQISRAEKASENVDNFYNLFGWNSSGMNYYDYKVIDLTHQFNKRREAIAKEYTKKYQEAILKDIGYEDIELGMQMLKEYGISTGRRSNSVPFTGKDTVTYTHRR